MNRALFVHVVMLLAGLHAVAAAAAEFPSRPLHLVVPYPAGGGGDSVGRSLASGLAGELGQRVLVENRPGASGLLGTDVVAKAPPDGYTLLLADRGTMVFNVGMFSKLPYEPAKDLVPVGKVLEGYFVLVTTSGLGVADLAGLRREIARRPGALSYGATSTASTLAMELLKQRAGIELLRVPYKGVAPALQDLIGGQVEVMMVELLSALPHLKAGTVKALAVTAPHRLSQLADVPTLAESGLAGFEAGTWLGLFAPRGTPQSVLSSLEAALVKVVRSAPVTGLIVGGGLEPTPATGRQLAAVLDRDLAIWPAQLRKWGVTAD